MLLNKVKPCNEILQLLHFLHVMKKWKLQQNRETRFEGEHDGSDGKESACNAGDPGLIPA